MKFKFFKRIYWIDTWAAEDYVEFYLRWHNLYTLTGSIDICVCKGRENSHKRGISQCLHRNFTSPLFSNQYHASSTDACGFGIEAMNRKFECKYNASLRRLYIGMWIIGLWLDFPRKQLKS